MQFYPIYGQIFKNGRGKTIPTLLEIATRHLTKKSPDFVPPTLTKSISQPFEAPKIKENTMGFNGYLPTFSEGPANKLFDFEKAKEFIERGELVLVEDPKESVQCVGVQGTLLAYCNIVAKNYDECIARFMEIGKRLVLKGAPWQV